MQLEFVSAQALLRDACPPNAPSLLWKHPQLDLRVEAGAINIICSLDKRKSLRHSAMLAGELARRKKQISPVRGVNPFTGVNESEDYDRLCASRARTMNVLYINTLTNEVSMEAAFVQTLPGMDKWIWTDRDRGGEFPYTRLGLFFLSVRSGSIMKHEAAKELKEYVKQNNIDVIVLNSFEFACRTQREKDDMVDLLKYFCDVYNTSVLIYTHEPEKRFRSGSRRGPMGALSILADWVSTIDAMAPELDVTLPGAPLECGEPVTEQLQGFDGPITYRNDEEVQTMLRNAPDSMLPREHIRPDGTFASQKYEYSMNTDAERVMK